MVSVVAQSLPAGDLMPSNASAALHRGHGAKQAPHSSTSSRAFYNSYYPAPPQHKPVDPSHDVPIFNLPPSPSYDRPAELSPGSVQTDGFPGASEMSRSLTDFGANPLHASCRSIPGSSNSHRAVFESGADGLCSQIDGLNISATPSSVFSVLSEHSQKQRQHQSRNHQTSSVFSALSSANSSHQTSPNTTQRMSSASMRSPSDSSSSSFMSRHGSTSSARASVSTSNSVVEELFEFEMDQSDDMRPASSSNSSSAHSPHASSSASSSSMAALNSPWRGVM